MIASELATLWPAAQIGGTTQKGSESINHPECILMAVSQTCRLEPMSSLSVSVSVIAGATSTTTTASKLVQMANGEYTAASVTADPTDAAKLGLTKEKDGNYGTQSTQVAAGPSASTQSSNGVQAALTTLTLGGA